MKKPSGYLIIEDIPHYGPRDEIVAWSHYTIRFYHTKAFAQLVVYQMQGDERKLMSCFNTHEWVHIVEPITEPIPF